MGVQIPPSAPSTPPVTRPGIARRTTPAARPAAPRGGLSVNCRPDPPANDPSTLPRPQTRLSPAAPSRRLSHQPASTHRSWHRSLSVPRKESTFRTLTEITLPCATRANPPATGCGWVQLATLYRSLSLDSTRRTTAGPEDQDRVQACDERALDHVGQHAQTVPQASPRRTGPPPAALAHGSTDALPRTVPAIAAHATAAAHQWAALPMPAGAFRNPPVPPPVPRGCFVQTWV